MWFSVAGFRVPIFGFREHVLLYCRKLLLTLDMILLEISYYVVKRHFFTIFHVYYSTNTTTTTYINEE